MFLIRVGKFFFGGSVRIIFEFYWFLVCLRNCGGVFGKLESEVGAVVGGVFFVWMFWFWVYYDIIDKINKEINKNKV